MNQTKKNHLTGLARVIEWLLTIALIVDVLTVVVLVPVFTWTFILGEPQDDFPNDKPRLTVKVPVGVAVQTINTVEGVPVTVGLEKAVASIPLRRSDIGVVIGFFGGGVLWMAIVAAGLVQLRRFVRSLRFGHPFVVDNANRLRSVAWMTLALGFVGFAVKSLIQLYVVRNYTSDEMSLGHFSVSLLDPFLITSLLIFMIAEVFKVGVEMKEEQDLTI